MEPRDEYVSCLKTSHGFSCLVLGSVSSFHISHASRFMTVSTVSLSSKVKCLFCVKTLAFLAESRPRNRIARCLLPYCKTAVLVDVVL